MEKLKNSTIRIDILADENKISGSIIQPTSTCYSSTNQGAALDKSLQHGPFSHQTYQRVLKQRTLHKHCKNILLPFFLQKKNCNCCLFIYMIERLWQVRWLLQFFYDAQNILNKTSSIILITSKVSSLTSYIAVSSNSPLFIVSLLHLQALQHAFFYIILFSKSIVN